MSYSHHHHHSSTGDNENENDVYVNFNQDSTSLAVGTKNGFKLYDLKNVADDKLELLYEHNADFSDHFSIIERLFSSSLLAVVSLSAPRTLKMNYYKKNTELVQYTYSNTILAVKLNRQRLVVCLEESIKIHNIADLQHIHSIKRLPRNPHGIIALAPSSDRCYLAYPASNTAGEVNIFDALKLDNKLTIAAHDNPLVSLTFDSLGIKLATASERGTVIRVFNTQSGDCIYEFRRGYARCVSIYSLSFSSDSMFLCASSNTETVHIFKLNENKPQEDDFTDMFRNCFRKICQTAGYFNTVADIMNQWRSFAAVRLPLSSSKTISTITDKTEDGHRVLIASTDGYLYVYDLNINDGGDCALIRQHRLIDNLVANPKEQESSSNKLQQ